MRQPPPERVQGSALSGTGAGGAETAAGAALAGRGGGAAAGGAGATLAASLGGSTGGKDANRYRERGSTYCASKSCIIPANGLCGFFSICSSARAPAITFRLVSSFRAVSLSRAAMAFNWASICWRFFSRAVFLSDAFNRVTALSPVNCTNTTAAYGRFGNLTLIIRMALVRF